MARVVRRRYYLGSMEARKAIMVPLGRSPRGCVENVIDTNIAQRQMARKTSDAQKRAAGATRDVAHRTREGLRLS